MQDDPGKSYEDLRFRMRGLQRSADEIALIALDITERRPARIETVHQTGGGEQSLLLRPGEATLSLFLELGPMIVLTGSEGLYGFRERPVDLGSVVETCQSFASRSDRLMRTANRRFVGGLQRSLAYLNGAWTDIFSPEEKPCVAIGLGGERIFAFRRDADGPMRELAVARPSYVGESLCWRLIGRVPDGTDAFLDASRFVVNRDAARSIIRLRRIDGSEEHRLLTIKSDAAGTDMAAWSDPIHSNCRVLRATKDGLLVHRDAEGGIKLGFLPLEELNLPLHAYYRAAMAR